MPRRSGPFSRRPALVFVAQYRLKQSSLDIRFSEGRYSVLGLPLGWPSVLLKRFGLKP